MVSSGKKGGMSFPARWPETRTVQNVFCTVPETFSPVPCGQTDNCLGRCKTGEWEEHRERRSFSSSPSGAQGQFWIGRDLSNLHTAVYSLYTVLEIKKRGLAGPAICVRDRQQALVQGPCGPPREAAVRRFMASLHEQEPSCPSNAPACFKHFSCQSLLSGRRLFPRKAFELDTLRPYQHMAVDTLIRLAPAKQFLLLQAATGAGKTVMASHIMQY